MQTHINRIVFLKHKNYKITPFFAWSCFLITKKGENFTTEARKQEYLIEKK